MDAVQNYTVSNTAEVGLDTNWADIKDPKEKKKIQNRIAQRSYRQRMKARLEKLQAKVNYHEQLSQEQQLNLDNTHRDDNLRGNQDSHPPVTLESLTPDSPDKQCIQPQVMQTTFYEHSIEKADKGLYIQPQLVNTTPPPQPIPQNRSLLADRADQTIKPTDKLQPDYMRLQKPPMVSEHPAPLTDLSAQEENARMMHRHQLFSPEVDVMNFNHPFDVWTAEMLAQTRRQNSYPTDPLGTPSSQHQQQHQPPPSVVGEPPRTGSGDGNGGTTVMGASTMADTLSSVSSVRSAGQGLEERFEDVLACTRAAGFESFDALVTAYYNGNFDESSPLAIEQRLSRNRGLPNVIADVFRGARSWSDWERRGFDEELLKTTENMLVFEGESNCNSLEGVPNILSAVQHGENGPSSTGQMILAMKKAIQNELPNLWALMMTLSVEHRDIWQRNRSNTVLAAILLLRYPGRISNDQLLTLVSGCL